MITSIVLLIIIIALGAAYIVAPRRVTTTVTQVSKQTVPTTVFTTIEKTVSTTVPTTILTTVPTTVARTETETVTRTTTMTKTETITTTKPMTLLELAEAIRKGVIDVGTTYGLALGQRFHNIHTIALGLQCTTCHQAQKYPDDYLYIRKYVVEKEAPQRGMPGVVDRGVCIGCHRQNSIAKPFYMPYYGSWEETSGASG
jgi:hypothetical protein